MNIEKISDLGREIQAYADAAPARRNTSGLSDLSTGTQVNATANGESTTPPPVPEVPVKPVDAQQAVEKLNRMMRSMQRDVSFSVDEDANATVIKIFKTETGELIKQFPPEEILAMRAKIRKSTGWLVDSRA